VLQNIVISYSFLYSVVDGMLVAGVAVLNHTKLKASVNVTLHNSVMCRLKTGTHSEKCVFRRFHHRANVVECTYTNLDSIAHYTPRLYGIAYCS
jgi:hypothetical protein